MRLNVAVVFNAWLIALCFLGLTCAWNTPTNPTSVSSMPIELSLPELSGNAGDLERVKATVWCALESSQVAVLKTPTNNIQMRGALAMAPDWRGEQFDSTEHDRLENCIQVRLDYLSQHHQSEGNDRSAWSFLFSNT